MGDQCSRMGGQACGTEGAWRRPGAKGLPGSRTVICGAGEDPGVLRASPRPAEGTAAAWTLTGLLRIVMVVICLINVINAIVVS